LFHGFGSIWELTDSVAQSEGVSIKPPGSGEMWAHVDGGESGRLQNLIATGDTAFVVWPRSHETEFKSLVNHGGKFKEISKTQLSLLHKRGVFKTVITARAGDVLVMNGGDLIHASPSVVGESARIMTYANFQNGA
jgi:hypothetical protein